MKNPFLGICLPKNILDLFPESSHTGTYVTQITQEMLKSNESNMSARLTGRKENGSQDPVLAESAIKAGHERSPFRDVTDHGAVGLIALDTATSTPKQGNGPSVETKSLNAESVLPASIASWSSVMQKHNKDECLLCSRTKVLNRIVEQTSLTITEPKDFASQNGKVRETELMFYSPESVISDDSANTSMPDKISNTILKNVIKMANPIMFKACRKILMEIKQKYPESFQDICLYSEVCRNMSECSYRMSVRRFIQEIFLDLRFDAFNHGVESVLGVAQQRYSEQKVLNNLKMLPLSPPTLQSSPTSVSHPLPPIAIPPHKLHALKSPPLASVYETSVENLEESPPQTASTSDEVDATVTLRLPVKLQLSPGGSTQVKAEVHRHSELAGGESLEPVRRRRFYTLELDLSCTKNKFPIKHRSPTGPSATSTLRRPVSFNSGSAEAGSLFKSGMYSSDQGFEASSRKAIVSSPISPPLGTLFCEQRLLTSSRSEATLSNKKDDGKENFDKMEKK